jgi:hypothetical protein
MMMMTMPMMMNIITIAIHSNKETEKKTPLSPASHDAT